MTCRNDSTDTRSLGEAGNIITVRVAKRINLRIFRLVLWIQPRVDRLDRSFEMLFNNSFQFMIFARSSFSLRASDSRKPMESAMLIQSSKASCTAHPSPPPRN